MATSIGTRRELIAGHFLPKVPVGHKCARMHGHNYMVDIELQGPVHDNGFIVDFYDVDKIVEPLFKKLDHTVLNDTEGLENPTAENISLWFRTRIQSELRMHNVEVRVRVWETPTCWALSSTRGF